MRDTILILFSVVIIGLCGYLCGYYIPKKNGDVEYIVSIKTNTTIVYKKQIQYTNIVSVDKNCQVAYENLLDEYRRCMDSPTTIVSNNSREIYIDKCGNIERIDFRIDKIEKMYYTAYIMYPLGLAASIDYFGFGIGASAQLDRGASAFCYYRW